MKAPSQDVRVKTYARRWNRNVKRRTPTTRDQLFAWAGWNTCQTTFIDDMFLLQQSFARRGYLFGFHHTCPDCQRGKCSLRYRWTLGQGMAKDRIGIYNWRAQTDITRLNRVQDHKLLVLDPTVIGHVAFEKVQKLLALEGR